MAEIVLTNAFVSVNGNDISASVKSVTLSYSAEMLDKTSMGDDTRNKIGGLKDWNMSIELNEDYAAAGLDSILFPLVGSTVPIILRPDAGVVSTSNPQFAGQGVIESYPPLGGAVGELASSSLSIQSGGTLARTTA